jgi:hypothetical protein
MDEIPEGLEDLLKDILGDEEKVSSPQSSSALAVIPKVEKEEEDLVDDEIDERILTLLGLEDVTDIDYSTYKSLLREKVAAARMSDSKMSTEEAELITNEFKRVKKLTGRFKVKKKKINVESFFETAQEKTESKENKEDKEDIPDGLDDLINEIREEVDLKKPDEVTSEESEEEEKDDKAEKFIKLTLAPSLSKIEKNLESILGTLTKQFQFDKKQSEKAADVAQTTRKREREKKSEGKIGGSKVKDTADKVVKPVKGMFDMIMDFFKNILLGGALLWLLNFLKNPEKAFQPIIDAINGIIDFLNDVIKTVFDFVFAPVNDALSGIWDGLNFLEDRLNDATALFGQEPIDNINEENKPKFEAPQIPKVENPFKKPESTPVQGMQGGGIVSFSMGNTSNLINNTNNKSINISDMSFTGGGSITSNSGQTITGMGADTQLIAVQPGEIVMSKPAVNYYGASNLLAMNKEGGGTNKPKAGKVMGMQGGGMVEVKGTGNTVEGTLKLKDSTGKQVGKTYSAISGTYAGMNVPQNRRSTTRNAPIPDGNYKLLGFEKHGPYPGLPGIGHWSTYIANASGSIGSRSGLMLHSDIGSNGTLGCVGVELGGVAGTKSEQEFLQAYQQVNPEKIKIALGGGGGDASEIASVDRKPTPDNSDKVAKIRPPSGRTNTTPKAPAAARFTGVVLPTMQQSRNQAPSSGSVMSGKKLPNISPIDLGNTELMVIKAIYNIVG